MVLTETRKLRWIIYQVVYPSFLADEGNDLLEIKEQLTWKKVLQVDERKGKVQGIVLKIDEEMKNFSIYILLAIEKDTKTILERLSKNELMRAPSAMYGSGTTGDTPRREKCTKGTRVDVLKRISEWATDPSSPPIFWLSGMAGTGKSTIAYTVCHDFDEDDAVDGARLCASFFCSRQVEAQQQLQNIIPTLAYQLACQSRSFAGAVVDVNQMIIHDPSKHVKKLLVTPWKQSMKDRRDELPLSLIVIDALDEIANDGGEQLLKELINSIRSEGVQGLKILVTSRPHPDIVDATNSLPRDTIFHLEDIKDKDGTEDIRTFLAARLPKLHSSSSSDHSEGLEKLVNLAGGLFIFAATAARLISPPDAKLSVTEQADQLSKIIHNQDMPSSDRGNVRGVNTLYKQVLSDAIPPQHSLSRLRILHAVVCALQPLTIAALAELVAEDSKVKDEEAAELCVGALHSVLYVRDKHV
ncbi:hypothetical protein K488DRAFT_92661, partial [Vararia minispora EC-137]